MAGVEQSCLGYAGGLILDLDAGDLDPSPGAEILGVFIHAVIIQIDDAGYAGIDQ